MGPGSTGSIILFFACLILSGFTSLAEASVFSLSKVRLRSMVDNGNRSAKRVEALLKDSDKLLSSILVGNNIANIGASSLSTALAVQLWGNTGVGIATGALTFIVLVFCEITPKTAAVRNADRFALAISLPLLWMTTILTPVIFILNFITNLLARLVGGGDGSSSQSITEEELLTMVDMSHEQGNLEVEEKHMIRNVFEFGDSDVREIMTPRVNAVIIRSDLTYAEVMDVFREHQFSRIPVYRDSPDEIIGILFIKDLALQGVNGDFNIEALVRPANFVYEFNNIAKVFSDMRLKHIGMSVVLDEYGMPSGIVTMEDFIEEIVGDIIDEYDDTDEQTVHMVAPDEFIVDGTISIDAFNEAVGSEITSEEFESIGGFLLGKNSELPSEGDTLLHENLTFTVEAIDNNRIETLRVKRLAAREEV